MNLNALQWFRSRYTLWTLLIKFWGKFDAYPRSARLTHFCVNTFFKDYFELQAVSPALTTFQKWRGTRSSVPRGVGAICENKDINVIIISWIGKILIFYIALCEF